MDDDITHGHAIRPVVMIVDDMAENLLALEAMLRRDDIEIVTARSGSEALEVLLARNVALALIDVEMPEINGFALAELVRGVARTRYVPIIFVTAGSSNRSWVFKGYEAGAVDFLFKPVDEHILRSKVDVFVRLDRQRQQLLQAEQMREMFLGILGHDLRNPLHGILVSSQLAMRRTKDDGIRDPLRRVLRSSQRMERMIEQLLDVTRIRLGGGLALAPVAADLRHVVQDVVEEMAEHEGRFSFEVHGDSRGTWDVDRMSQVVSNLVGNAVAHSPRDTPVAIRLDGTDDATLALHVQNGGPPIPDDVRQVLFEPFRGRRRTGGLGLGLYVTKQFVAAHGGTLDLESSEATGTRVTVRIPRHTGSSDAVVVPLSE